MPRYEDAKVVRAAWFDPDEDASLRADFGFAAAQRLVLYASRVDAITPTSEDEITQLTEAMGKLILELYAGWRLRKRGTPYKEGSDRPILDFSAAEIAALPVRDLTFLYREGARSLRTAGPTTDNSVTPTAAGEGLTPANFRPGSATGEPIPGGPDA